MYMPVLEINLRKLEENARTEKALLASSGIDVMAKFLTAAWKPRRRCSTAELPLSLNHEPII